MSSASSAPASSAPACWYPGRRALDPPIQYERQADDAVPVQHLRVHYWHDMDHESRAAIHAIRLKTRLKDERVHKSHILCGVGRRPLARVVLLTGTSTSRRLVHVAPRVLAPDCLHVTDEALHLKITGFCTARIHPLAPAGMAVHAIIVQHYAPALCSSWRGPRLDEYFGWHASPPLSVACGGRQKAPISVRRRHRANGA